MKLAKALLLPAALIALAEIGGRAAGTSDSIAPPTAILRAFGEVFADGSLLSATRDTMMSAFGGFSSARDWASSPASRWARSAPSTG